MVANRSRQVGIELIAGQGVLQRGHELARDLWNYVRHCAVGYNRHLARVRGEHSLAGKLPRYATNFDMQKALIDYPAYHNLASRCAEYTVREFDIAMRSWFANLRSNPRARPPRKVDDLRTLGFEVGRNAKPLGNWMYRLTVLGGHIEERHCIIRLIPQPGMKQADVKLIRVKADSTGVVCIHQEFAPPPGQRVAAVDIGIDNLMAIAYDVGDTALYSGRALVDVHRKYEIMASRCKPPEWHKGVLSSRQSQRKKSYKHKSTNIRRLALHNLTTHFINECVEREVGTVVVGNLANLKNTNQKLSQWLRGELVRQLQYKAEEVGIAICKINEAWTSQTCSTCGGLAKRGPRGVVRCTCGATCNSDINAAINILNRYLLAQSEGQRGVGAVLPGPPSLAVAASGTGKASQMYPGRAFRFDFRTDWSVGVGKHS